MTLRESFAEHGSLANVSQLGWFGMPTKGMPLQFAELGIVLIVIYNGSWINTMLKFWLTSRMVLMRKLFFNTFWENIFRSFIHFERISLDLSKSYCGAIHSWMSWVLLVVPNFCTFLWVLFLIEMMFPKGTVIWVRLMFAFAVEAFECVRTGFTLLCL